MTTATLVNKVRASSTQPTGSACQACPSVGLPILPVRYAVVPKTLPGYVLPSTCSDPLLAPEDLGKVQIKNHKYVLRTLRAGFLYLTYKDPVSGATIWQCFMISPSGALREIPLASRGLVLPGDPTPPCQRAAHNINSRIISIKHPEKIAKAHIGYSEHFWSPHALGRNKKALQPRMTPFSPATWIKSHAQTNAFPVADVAKNVVEYSSANLQKHLSHGHSEYQPRTGQAAGLQARMDKISPGKGMVLAMPDPIGCVSDLNFYRMHALNEFHEYLRNGEVSWKLSSSAQIDGLRACVAAQIKESMKDVKPKQIGHPRSPSSVRVVSKEEQIKTAEKEGWEKFEDHYDEKARTNFISAFNKQCDAYEARILKLDTDYVSWKKSASLLMAMADYDRVPGYSCIAASKVLCDFLQGGPISRASIDSWREMLALEATDLKNYAISAILLNQKDWLERFKNADAKDLVGHVWGDNHGKIFDFLKNFAEADEQKNHNTTANQAANKVTEWAAKHVITLSGAIAGVTADLAKTAAKKTGHAADAATLKVIAALDNLQIKSTLAYGHLHAQTGFALFTIELTLDEWHRLMSEHLKKSMEKVSKQAGKGFAAMAVAASVHLPPGSATSTKLIAFTFWMTGTVQQVTEMISSLGASASGVATRAAKGVAQGVVSAAGATGKAGASGVGAAAGGSANGVRKIRLLGHSLPASLMARFPTSLSSTAAGSLAIRVSRNSLTMISSADVKLSAPALGLQVFALRKSWSDFQNSTGFKHQDASWAVASSLLGVTSASLDLAGKAWKAIRVNTTVLTHARSAAVIKGAGFIGAGASIVDCVQAVIKSNVMAKRGDTDAARLHGAAAGVAGIAAGASIAMAFGYTALLGPVGLLLICIAAGIALTYFALNAQDSAIDIWLDRSKFGRHKRSEGRFLTSRQEADSLEMVHRSISIELEWLDKTFTSISTNEIAISIKRPGKRNDALILGLMVEGTAGKRKALYSQTGIRSANGHYNGGWPVNLSKMKSANQSVGAGFEAKTLKGESSVHSFKEDEADVTAWEEVVELDPAKFSKAKLWIRYFPNRQNGSEFFDDELLVADDD